MNRDGPCDPAFRTTSVYASCGPADGPAWAFTLTRGAIACEAEPTDGSVRFEIWHDLNTAPSARAYELREDFSGDGQARICTGGIGAPCVAATGTVTVHFFVTSDTTNFDYDLRTADGRRFVQSNVEGATWCRVLGPGCG